MENEIHRPSVHMMSRVLYCNLSSVFTILSLSADKEKPEYYVSKQELQGAVSGSQVLCCVRRVYCLRNRCPPNQLPAPSSCHDPVTSPFLWLWPQSRVPSLNINQQPADHPSSSTRQGWGPGEGKKVIFMAETGINLKACHTSFKMQVFNRCFLPPTSTISPASRSIKY